jgi:drug/metabolite transporter (DMT)-like permease
VSKPDAAAARWLPVPFAAGSAGSALPTLGLLAVTAVWGSTFFLIRDLMVYLPAPDFLAVRFAVAAGALLPFGMRAVRRLGRTAIGHGLVLGLIYGVAQVLQTEGLGYVSASVSGFITGMYVVFTPLLAALLLRARLAFGAWIAVVLAVMGLALLTLRGFAFGPGEALTLAAAGLYAVHIVCLGAWSTQRDAFGLSIVQMGVIALVCAVSALPGGIAVPRSTGDWLSLLYMALAAGAFALIVQTWAQAHLSATRAAVIMCAEPVWAALFAVLLGGERLTYATMAGGGLILAAMYISELTARGRSPADSADGEPDRDQDIDPVRT